VNLLLVLAAIFISLPVCGFGPMRAARFTALNVPNPTKAILSPSLRAAVGAAMKLFRAFSACAFVHNSSKMGFVQNAVK
jgi:hypothetical protein